MSELCGVNCGDCGWSVRVTVETVSPEGETVIENVTKIGGLTNKLAGMSAMRDVQALAGAWGDGIAEHCGDEVAMAASVA